MLHHGVRGGMEAYRTLIVAKADMQTQQKSEAASEHLFSVSIPVGSGTDRLSLSLSMAKGGRIPCR